MTQPLRILADANIPFVAEAFAGYGEIRQLPGHAISRSDVADVDVLLVRSVTPVDGTLLAGSSIRFVGTATTGTDHVDRAYLDQSGIGFGIALGSNAGSVVEYTLASLISVAADTGRALRGQTLGVVGCGRIGGGVAKRATALGMEVLRCDPPLDERNPGPSLYVGLEDLLAQSDFVSLHTPLTSATHERHPTYHLFGPAALAAMKPEAVLVNTARGAIVDNVALKAALATNAIGGAVLDVWEGEPEIDIDLARLVRIATPHIAGYSFDGKVEGTRMLEEALRNWLVGQGMEVPAGWNVDAALEALPRGNLNLHALPVTTDLDSLNEIRWLNVLVRQAYNLRRDDTLFRQAVLGAPAEQRGFAFRELRRAYPIRRAWERITVKTIIPVRLREVVVEALGMTVVE